MPTIAVTNAGITGSFSASGVSDPFTTFPAAFVAGRRSPDGLGLGDGWFKLSAVFGSAVGSLTLTMSTDGGATFAPFKTGQVLLSAMTSTGALGFIQMDTSALYRLECTLTSGSISYSVGVQESFAGLGLLLGLPNSVYSKSSSLVSYTPAQMQVLRDSKLMPMSDADVSALTVGYKICRYAKTNTDGTKSTVVALATLSFPSGVQIAKSIDFYLGNSRSLKATSAKIISIADDKGSAILSANSWLFPSVSYNVNATILAVDNYQSSPNGQKSVGSFDSKSSLYGIYFYPTALEAVDGIVALLPTFSGVTMPDPTALGL